MIDPKSITIEQINSFLDARIKTTENHIQWYKKFNQDKSYMHEELAILLAIRDEIKNPRGAVTP